MLHERTSRGSKLLLAAVLVAYLVVAYQAMHDDDQLDLFIYRAGAQSALEGHSPYHIALIRLKVAQQFPPQDDNAVALNCGFFLPPQGISMFAPLAKNQSWDGAQAMWFFVLSCFGVFCGTLAWTFGRAPEHRGSRWVFIILLVLINPITIPALVVGQTGLLFVGCIALGQYCFENDSPRFGCFLWALTFVKPHLAIPFLALAWVLGGWKRAAGIAFCVAALNLLGALMVRWDFWDALRLFREYVEYVGTAHQQVKYNLVAQNYQILSWNRVLAALGGPAIDLKIWMVLLGFASWGGLIYGRLRLRGPLSRARLDPAYLLAAATLAALFFAQVIAYELILLVLLAPLILRHFDDGRKFDAWLLVALIIYLAVPLTVMDQIAERLRLDDSSRGRTLLLSHKCFGMAALALFLLMRGQPPRPAISASTSSSSPSLALVPPQAAP